MYKHTQFGTVIVVAIGVMMVVGLGLGALNSWHPAAFILLGVFTVVLAFFFNLTVEVTSEAIRCRFGPGLISKTIPMDQVKEARPVRNRWFYGWGIKRAPGAWMFNVSGLDAVELTLVTGKKFHIGTDDPAGLLAAIDQMKGPAD